MPMSARVVRFLVASSLPCVSSVALAQTFPVRPIRLLVPFGAGSGTDVVARLLAPRLTENLGQTVVVDNRPGAGGIVGSDIIAKSAPEGYNLLFALSSHAINASLYAKLPYDSLKDFTAVTQLVSGPLLLVVYPGLPVASVKELIAHVRANPGKLSYSSAGIGSPTHLAAELMKSMTALDMAHIPFNGAVPAITSTARGQSILYFAGTASALPFVKSGRLKPIAVTGTSRSSLFPDIPTVMEAGVSGYEVDQWYGILAPAGTPRPVTTRLHGAFAAVLQLPDIRERMRGVGVEPVGSTPERFAAYLQSEVVKYAKVVKASGARVD